ncbi:MAG: hypothetical protein JJ900_04655 [Rhodospirillales bacterium]|nr:hypothetical protein [Rhodospirillales bacterium]MBO6786121.1 hypothetical protein [Rhodospirillales bacterium]
MTSSRVDRWIFFAALIALGYGADAQAQATGAPAELTAPRSLQPPTGEQPGDAGTPAAGDDAQASGPRRLVPSGQAAPSEAESRAEKRARLLGLSGKSGIQVDGLTEIDDESVGVLTQGNGGFGLEMWKGMTRAESVSLVDALPKRLSSAALREAASMLLLSRAKAPVAVTDDAPSLLSARARALIDMGDVQNAELLLAAAPRQGRPSGLDVVDAKIQILKFDNARACGLARNSAAKSNDDFWQRLRVYCDALDGKADSVNFGLSLLREISGDDQALVLLADAVVSKSPILLESVEKPTPIHVALSRAAKVQLPPNVSESEDPLVLYAAALAPNLTIGSRIEAAERAIPMGAAPAAELRRLYQQVTFAEEDLSNALTRAQEIGGAAARALLYQAAAKQNIPSARAEIISAAFDVAREDKRYMAAVQAFRPLIDRLPPSPEMVWFALTGVRAYLTLGDVVGTDRWLALLRASATVRDEQKLALARVRPLARLLGAGDKSVSLETVIGDWRASLQDADTPGVSSLRALVNGMFMAVGEDLPEKAWDGVAAGAPKNQVMPSPVVWFMFRDSMRAVAKEMTADKPMVIGSAGLSGVTRVAQNGSEDREIPPGAAKPALYALQAVGNAAPGEQGVSVVYEVVAAFRALGMEHTARKLALETVLAAGL